MINAEYNPLVSVIIPVKNGAATLSRCLRAVRRSNYKNYEIIVVNDNSSDKSAEIASSFGVRLINVETGSGANNARNLGATGAMGEILMFIDADIVVERETL